MIPLSNADFLVTVAEPTRLRVLNCLAAAPLFVSDIVELLGLPQPTVSRHLKVLRDIEAVRDTPIPPYVLYRVAPAQGTRGRLMRAVLDAIRADPAGKSERAAALVRSRGTFQARVAEAGADAG
jgi:DNA-binding transcriptional ArsR family regulator